MAIKKKNNRYHELEVIRNELDKESKRTYQEFLKGKRSVQQGALLLGVALLIGGGIWSVKSNLNRFDWSEKSEISIYQEDDDNLQNAFTRRLVASKEDFAFNWTLTDYEGLVVGDKQTATGDSLSSIIEKFGNPSSARLIYDEQTVAIDYKCYDYDIYEDRRQVSLTFYKNGDDYYLKGKNTYNMTDDQFQIQKASEDLSWTAENFSELVVGSADTGAGGATYEDVIKIGGLPQESTISGYHSGTLKYVELSLVYRTEYYRDNKNVFIRLEKQEDGTYRVSSKVSESLTEEVTD
ncbi:MULTISPECIES: hypothetical protein [Streptococcus]|uniref:DUF4179 domain-containing protein n=1 Tax=Streptococcus caledonicus TaxID=2614158 RepID=A0ABW0UE45_9STRE|nr:hypothetical protein [Streptococcus sp. S784/96/1]